jgi:hypothetical protein
MQQNLMNAASSLLSMASAPAPVQERSRSPPKKGKGQRPNDSDDDDAQPVNSYYNSLGGSGQRAYPVKRRKMICKAIFGKRLNLVAHTATMTVIRTDRLVFIGTGLAPDTDLGNLKVMTGSTHAQIFDALINLTSDRRDVIAQVRPNCDNIEEISDTNGWLPEWIAKYKSVTGLGRPGPTKNAHDQIKASL